MSDMETFVSLLRTRLQECRDIQLGEALPSIKSLARKKVIDALTVEHEDNWQCVATPYDIIGEMCDMVMGADFYVVMFSLEFLEVLIKERGVGADRVLFVADNESESLVASHVSMYGVRSVIFSKFNYSVDKGCDSFLYSLIETIGGFMKFGKLAVIGNPPYQIQSEAQQSRDGGKQQAKPIYHSFVEGVIDNMNPDYFSMIIPSRWMVGGMGLDNHRDRMMNDTHMKKIVHFGGSHTIFPTVKIDGGVNYFLWEKDYSGDCEFVNGNTTTKRLLNSYDIILQDNNVVGILDKVMKISSSYINSTCYGNKPFGLATNFKKFKESGVKCICQGKKDKFVDSDSFTDKNAILGKWKVCIGAAFGETGTDKFRVFSDPFVIEPNAICTETYIVVNIFDSKKEADCFISYMKTKLFRFMLLQRKATQHMNKDKFSWVPDMLDYSASWSDKELYKHFNLSRQEIAYIESKIKEI